MKNILIIGGNGFIGKHLVKSYIKQGNKITVFDKNKIKKCKCKQIIKNLIFIDKEVKGYDIIIDLAGSTDNYAINDGEPFRDIEANCAGTLALLEAIRKYNPKVKLIYASTFFVVGDPEKLPVKEDVKCNPLGLYGATKLCAEHFCKIYHNLFNINVSIIRFCNVYGPGEPGFNKKKAAFNYLVRQAVLNKKIDMYSTGDIFRDYIYISDIISACRIVTNKGKPGEIYFAGNSKRIKFKELMKIIAKHTGAKILNIEPPEFHKRVGIKNFICDNSKLKKLGWIPKVNEEQGILKTIQSYKGDNK
jgi:UDP-glucose 4-epimerase